MLDTRKLISLAMAAFFLLFCFHLFPFLGINNGAIRVRPGDVESVTLFHNRTPYTLSFDQQNRLVHHLNRAVPVLKLTNPPTKDVDGVERITIHRFSEPEIVLTPVGTSESNVYFLAPEWYDTGYLMDVTGMELRRLFTAIHD